MADVVAIVGSSRKGGNTETLAGIMLERIAARGFTTELIALAGKEIAYCAACEVCQTRKRCRIEDDFQPIFPKLVEAKGIILATPVYSYGPTPQLLALATRAGRVSRAIGDPEYQPTPELGGDRFRPTCFARKIGAAIAVARRAGGAASLSLLNNFFTRNHMFLVGSIYPSIAFGNARGEVLKDEEGVINVKLLGDNFAWLMERVYGK